MNSDTKIDTKAHNLDTHHKSRVVVTRFKILVPDVQEFVLEIQTTGRAIGTMLER